MALAAGTRLGPYEILEPIGAGGMGEVYRALDTRLDRTVALKVLPERLAADPELKARFEREARAISSLAHPNICTLHDVGEEDGHTFLVMEHLAGQTLADRLKKGPLPLPQALEVATQLAEGLSAAHRQGIIHRDLKPGNVMLTKTGARLLDFGLARFTDRGERPAVNTASSVPTEPEPLTAVGTVMGTLPYMAPEQVEGQEADARTDLWALGAVLYEMISGRRPFEASSPPSLAAAILEREPAPLPERQPRTPPSLERLIRRCLAKNPDGRLDTAHDVALRLREIAEVDEGAARSHRPPRWVVPTLLAAVLAGLLIGAIGVHSWRDQPHDPILRSEIDLTPGRALVGVHPDRTEVALSPNGATLAWAGGPQGRHDASSLHLRRMDTGDVTRLAGIDGWAATQPFFSPNGQWVGFVDVKDEARVLRKVPVDGGLAVDVAELAERPMGLSWGPDGHVYLGSTRGGILSVPADGGAPHEITTPDPGLEAGHRLPSALPSGEDLLYTAMPHAFGVRARIETVSLSSGARKVIVEDAADGRLLPTGHLVFARRGVLMAAPLSLNRLELTATPVPVVDGVSQALNMGAIRGNSGAAQFSVSESGLLAYAPGGIDRATPGQLLLLDEAGQAEPVPGFDRPLAVHPHFSPDGRQLAFTEQASAGLLWLFDLERQTYRALTSQGVAGWPRWSPDGKRLALHWSEAGPYDLWVLSPDGNEKTRLTEGNRHQWVPSWSPDGRFLAFVDGSYPDADILLYRSEDRETVPFLNAEAFEVQPEFSPDGRWLAYASNESGSREVYVTSFPHKERTLTVSHRGGTGPAWSRDGRRLYYYSMPSSDGSRSMMSVTVRNNPVFSLGRPTVHFSLPPGTAVYTHSRAFELHPDGRRFLLRVEAEVGPPPPITRLNLVHNWFAELERLSPTR